MLCVASQWRTFGLLFRRVFTIEQYRTSKHDRDVVFCYYSSIQDTKRGPSAAKRWMRVADISHVHKIAGTDSGRLLLAGQGRADESQRSVIASNAELCFEVYGADGAIHYFLQASNQEELEMWVSGLQIAAGLPQACAWPMADGSKPPVAPEILEAMHEEADQLARGASPGPALSGSIDQDQGGLLTSGAASGGRSAMPRVSSASTESSLAFKGSSRAAAEGIVGSSSGFQEEEVGIGDDSGGSRRPSEAGASGGEEESDDEDGHSSKYVIARRQWRKGGSRQLASSSADEDVVLDGEHGARLAVGAGSGRGRGRGGEEELVIDDGEAEFERLEKEREQRRIEKERLEREVEGGTRGGHGRGSAADGRASGQSSASGPAVSPTTLPTLPPVLDAGGMPSAVATGSSGESKQPPAGGRQVGGSSSLSLPPRPGPGGPAGGRALLLRASGALPGTSSSNR